MKKIHIVEPSQYLPGIAETAPIRRELRYVATARIILAKRKELERKAAPRLKAFLLWIGLGRHTDKIRNLHQSLTRAELTVLQKARDLIEQKRRAWVLFSGKEDQTRTEFIEKNNAFNNFCLGVAWFDQKLGSKIENEDRMSSACFPPWSSQPSNSSLL